MTLDPHIIYLDGSPRAITYAQSQEHAVESFRAAMLGQNVTAAVTAQSAWEAPIDDVVRVGLLGLYARIFQADAAAAQAQARGRPPLRPA